MAEVTIGVAVYQGAATVRAALDSLVAQTFKDCEILISDNASSDGSSEICEEFARRFAHIRYVRRATTLPIATHFRTILSEARTPYFMWAAADDLWAPSFVATQHAFLQAHPDYVASQTRVLFLVDGLPSRMATGTFALRGSVAENLRRFLANPADNSRFYSLFRTEALLASYPEADFHAVDWLVSAETLASGRHHEAPSVLMLRDETDAPAYVHSVEREHHSRILRTLPLLALTAELVRRRRIPLSPALVAKLIRLNAHIALRFWSYRARAAAQRALERPRARWIEAPLRAFVERTAPGIAERRLLAQAGSPLQPTSNATSPPLRIEVRAFGWQPLSPVAGPPPDVSVILVVRNQLLDILAIMQSLQPATQPLTFELIVADLGSTDATALCLSKRMDLTYVSMPAATDFAQAANAAVQRARGRTLVFIEPEAKLHTGCIRMLAQAASDRTATRPQCQMLTRTNVATGAEPHAESAGKGRTGIFALPRPTFMRNGGSVAGARSLDAALKRLSASLATEGGDITTVSGAVVSLPAPGAAEEPEASEQLTARASAAQHGLSS